MKLVLASGSPRRREILEGLGIDVEVRTAGHEPPPERGEESRDYAIRAARSKAREVAQVLGALRWVIAADTVVAVEGEILGKPKDDDDARRMLRLLSGRSHEVTTAFCIYGEGREQHVQAVTTVVHFSELSPGRIERYIRAGEHRDKAGAYAIQGRGMALVRSIEGSYSNVVGLPAAEVLEALERLVVVEPSVRGPIEKT